MIHFIKRPFLSRASQPAVSSSSPDPTTNIVKRLTVGNEVVWTKCKIPITFISQHSMLTCNKGQQMVFPAGLLSWQLQKPTGRIYFLVNSTASQEQRILKALVYDPTEPQWRQSGYGSNNGEPSPWCWKPGGTSSSTPSRQDGPTSSKVRISLFHTNRLTMGRFHCFSTPRAPCSQAERNNNVLHFIFNFSLMVHDFYWLLKSNYVQDYIVKILKNIYIFPVHYAQ